MLGAALLTSAAALRAAPANGAGFVYTANEGGNSISAIDLRSGQVKTTAVSISPHNVQISRDGRLLLAVGMVASGTAKDNNLSVVDMTQRKVVATIKTGASPHGLRFSPNGREIYVANTGGNSVPVISVAAAKEVSRIWVGKAPVQVGFMPDDRRAIA